MALFELADEIYQELQGLQAEGLRTDYTLWLHRYPEQSADEKTSWMLDDSPSDTPLQSLQVIAPEVKIFQGFNNRAIEQSQGGGVIEIGDHIVKFPRAQVIEDFLNLKLINPELDSTKLYPEMPYVVFELDGEFYSPVRWLPDNVFITVFIRKQA